jgi:hypothetical protein
MRRKLGGVLLAATVKSCQEMAIDAACRVFLIGVREAMAFHYANGTWTVASGDLR